MADEGIGVGEEMFLGHAKDFFQLSIYDARKEHIVTLQLKRREGMTTGDLAQLQNYLWTQLGLAIRDDKSLQARLKLGGIQVLTEPPAAPEAAPGA